MTNEGKETRVLPLPPPESDRVSTIAQKNLEKCKLMLPKLQGINCEINLNQMSVNQAMQD